MVQVNLKELIGKLNETGRRSLEAAAGLCLSRTNYNVELEHWLLKLLETENSDVSPILKFFGVDASHLSADLTRVVDGLKTGNSRPPALSPNVVDIARAAWLIASVDFGRSNGSFRTYNLCVAQRRRSGSGRSRWLPGIRENFR